MENPIRPAAIALVAAAALQLASSSRAQTVFFELEPNDTKSEATLADCALAGDFFAGTPWCPPQHDGEYFRIRVCPLPPGIYRHQLDLFNAPLDYRPSIRGRTQNQGNIHVNTDVPVQAATPGTFPSRFNQWYGFGKNEEVYYDVGDTDACRAFYEVELLTTPVAPVLLPGPLSPGPITITTVGQGHSTDTELWVYDADFHPLPSYGNDDAGPNEDGSTLVRNYPAGTYYLAVSDAGLANDLPSPADDDFRNGRVLDFPGVLVAARADAGVDLSFEVSDGGTTIPVVAVKSDPFEVLWYRLDVTGPPAVESYCHGDGSGAACPCGNESAPDAGEGCRHAGDVTAFGRGGLLVAAGSTSVALDDQILHGRQLPRNDSALLYAGLMPSVATPLGDGLLCLGGSLQRLDLLTTNPAGDASWGPGLSALTGHAAGTTVRYQIVYRDPGGACGTNFNWTNALAVTLVP